MSSSIIETRRQSLEARANVLRARFANTIDAIARRGRSLTSPREQLRKHAKEIALGGAGLSVLLLGGIAASIIASRRRARKLPRERVQAIQRWWKHPDRVAKQGQRPMLLEIVRNVLIGGVSFLAMQFIKREGTKVLPVHEPRVVRGQLPAHV